MLSFSRLRRVSTFGLVSFAVGGLAAGSSPVAYAQVTAQTSAMAEALFRQGREAMKAGKTQDACAKFEESQRLEPKLGTLLNLAICNDKRGRHATAWAQFGEAATMARREGLSDQETYARNQKVAVEKKLTRVVVQIAAPPPGLVIELDSAAFSTTMIGAPLPVDAGTHALEARAPGRAPYRTTFEAPPGPKTITVNIPDLAPAGATTALPPPGPGGLPAPVPAEGEVTPPAPMPEAGPGDAGEGSDLTWLAITGFSVGGAGILLGAITGGISLSQTNQIKDDCGDAATCPGQRDDIDAATLTANLSNVGFAIGAAGAITGVIALLVDGSGDDANRTTDMGLVAGPTFIGYRSTF
ncbi:MAG: hypothetical protein AAF928_01750 [Myxococcota bacterium]